MPARILLYGRDSDLLQTRGGVLESAGFQVCVATKLLDIDACFISGRIDAMILCHTLSGEECRQALGMARRRNSGIKAILLAGNRSTLSEQELYDGIFEAFQGPGALIATVGRVLVRREPLEFRNLGGRAESDPDRLTRGRGLP